MIRLEGKWRRSFLFFRFLPGTFGINHIPPTSISHLLSCIVHLGRIQSEWTGFEIHDPFGRSLITSSSVAISEEKMNELVYFEQKVKWDYRTISCKRRPDRLLHLYEAFQLGAAQNSVFPEKPPSTSSKPQMTPTASQSDGSFDGEMRCISSHDSLMNS
jgi:hypothetical protein